MSSYIWIDDNEPVCANCAHYYDHYAYNGRHYIPCTCGHCVYPRIKHRKPTQSCERFKKKED